MLIARMSNGVMVLGIDAENVKRLKEGRPILKALGKMQEEARAPSFNPTRRTP
jgi:hypothetical protein